MKICITNKRKSWATAKTGKGFFVQRLITELTNRGVEVTTDPEAEVDVTLGIGKFEFKPKGKAVLRLGACHIDTNSQWKKLNARKKKALKRANGVIYQSQFSKKLCHAFLGKPKCPETVIFNGANPNEFDVEPYKSPYKYNFLASTRVWTCQKRLPQIYSAWYDAKIPNSCLWVCGEVGVRNMTVNDNRINTSITLLGLVDQKTLASLYKLCDAMIDITWLSACPNNVVEALVAGCPAISSNDGGIHELGWSDKKNHPFNYACIRSDKIWNMKKPLNLNKPPKFYQYGLIGNIEGMAYHQKKEFTYGPLHISTIAKQYLDFFNDRL